MFLNQWANSSYVRNIQQQMLSGQIPIMCQSCVKEESMTGRSLRTDSLHDYQHQIFTDTKIDFVDYRANNICNFKCRSCSPKFSHGIDQEVKNSLVLQKFFKSNSKKIVTVNDVNTDWINDNLYQIKRLMLTGGEPTRMPEIRCVIERIMYDKVDVQVLITTNCSFEDDFWYELTRLHKNLHWTISLDAVGAAAETIRYGTDWNIVSKNAQWLASHAVSLNVNTTITHLNILHLAPLLKFVKQLKQDSKYPRGLHGNQGLRQQFFVVHDNSHLAIDCMPAELKAKAIDHLNSCFEIGLDEEQTQTINGIMQYLKQPCDSADRWKLSMEYNKELDRIRGEKYWDLYEKETFVN